MERVPQWAVIALLILLSAVLAVIVTFEVTDCPCPAQEPIIQTVTVDPVADTSEAPRLDQECRRRLEVLSRGLPSAVQQGKETVADRRTGPSVVSAIGARITPEFALALDAMLEADTDLMEGMYQTLEVINDLANRCLEAHVE